jgi:hypothetical protein
MDFQDRFSIDQAGNLYFDGMWVYINHSDNIDFYQMNLTRNIMKVSNDIKTKEDPLQVKVIDEELKEIRERFVDSDNEDEFGENEVLLLQNYLYNPEMKFIKPNKNNHDEEEDDEDDESPYITINGDFNQFKTDFDLANYEVFMLDSNNSLFSYTEIVNDNPLYRITVHPKNRIELNIIGTKSILYSMNCDSSNIIHTKIISIQYHNLK